jgi:hypothetical protein
MEVTDADIDGEIADIAESAGKSPEELRSEWEEAGVLAVLEETVMHRKAVRWLMDHVEVVEEEPGTGEQGEEAAEEQPKKPKRARKSAKKEE